MAEPTRIAYLVNRYPAVSHSFIRREIQALERQGFEVLRIALRGWGEPLADADDVAERKRTRFVLQRGAVALLGPLCAAAVRRPGRWLAAFRMACGLARGSDRALPYHLVSLAEACVVAAWLRAEGAVHLHAHFGTNSAEVAMLASKLGDFAYSFTVHGPDEFDRPRELALASKIRHAAFVVGISSYTRSQLFRWAEARDWPKVHVVHCGLDGAFRDAPGSGANEARRLVCVGRLSSQKGHLFLLDAMRKAFDRSETFELVLAGDGELRGTIEDRARQLGLAGHVRVTGWISGVDVKRELLESRALVLPSFAEGLPVVIMEAMAMCRPVVTTYVAGIPELVRDGVTGWLAPAGDADAMADAMVACLEATPGMLARMGNDGRSRVLDRHDIETEAGKLAGLFRECISAPPERL